MSWDEYLDQQFRNDVVTFDAYKSMCRKYGVDWLEDEYWDKWQDAKDEWEDAYDNDRDLERTDFHRELNAAERELFNRGKGYGWREYDYDKYRYGIQRSGGWYDTTWKAMNKARLEEALDEAEDIDRNFDDPRYQRPESDDDRIDLGKGKYLHRRGGDEGKILTSCRKCKAKHSSPNYKFCSQCGANRLDCINNPSYDYRHEEKCLVVPKNMPQLPATPGSSKAIPPTVFVPAPEGSTSTCTTSDIVEMKIEYFCGRCELWVANVECDRCKSRTVYSTKVPAHNKVYNESALRNGVLVPLGSETKPSGGEVVEIDGEIIGNFEFCVVGNKTYVMTNKHLIFPHQSFIRSRDRKHTLPVDKSRVISAPVHVDLCAMEVPNSTPGLWNSKSFNIERVFQWNEPFNACFVDVCRNNTWYRSVSQKLSSHSLVQSLMMYQASTEQGDCGKGVISNENHLIGFHKGNVGDGSNNTFVFFGPQVKEWLKHL
jgi:hypothetical protein